MEQVREKTNYQQTTVEHNTEAKIQYSSIQNSEYATTVAAYMSTRTAQPMHSVYCTLTLLPTVPRLPVSYVIHICISYIYHMPKSQGLSDANGKGELILLFLYFSAFKFFQKFPI